MNLDNKIKELEDKLELLSEECYDSLIESISSFEVRYGYKAEDGKVVILLPTLQPIIKHINKYNACYKINEDTKEFLFRNRYILKKSFVLDKDLELSSITFIINN